MMMLSNSLQWANNGLAASKFIVDADNLLKADPRGLRQKYFGISSCVDEKWEEFSLTSVMGADQSKWPYPPGCHEAGKKCYERFPSHAFHGHTMMPHHAVVGGDDATRQALGTAMEKLAEVLLVHRSGGTNLLRKLLCGMSNHTTCYILNFALALAHHRAHCHLQNSGHTVTFKTLANSTHRGCWRTPTLDGGVWTQSMGHLR